MSKLGAISGVLRENYYSGSCFQVVQGSVVVHHWKALIKTLHLGQNCVIDGHFCVNIRCNLWRFEGICLFGVRRGIDALTKYVLLAQLFYLTPPTCSAAMTARAIHDY